MWTDPQTEQAEESDLGFSIVQGRGKEAKWQMAFD